MTVQGLLSISDALPTRTFVAAAAWVSLFATGNVLSHLTDRLGQTKRVYVNCKKLLLASSRIIRLIACEGGIMVVVGRPTLAEKPFVGCYIYLSSNTLYEARNPPSS